MVLSKLGRRGFDRMTISCSTLIGVRQDSQLTSRLCCDMSDSSFDCDTSMRMKHMQIDAMEHGCGQWNSVAIILCHPEDVLQCNESGYVHCTPKCPALSYHVQCNNFKNIQSAMPCTCICFELETSNICKKTRGNTSTSIAQLLQDHLFSSPLSPLNILMLLILTKTNAIIELLQVLL